MRCFPTGVARHPRVATQWYHLLLLAAYGSATAHDLLRIVNGEDSAVFHFLSLVTLIFDLAPSTTRATFLYGVPKCDV